MIFFTLFYTFFMIGLFGFGGGYGMISLIQTSGGVRAPLDDIGGVYQYRSYLTDDTRTYRY